MGLRGIATAAVQGWDTVWTPQWILSALAANLQAEHLLSVVWFELLDNSPFFLQLLGRKPQAGGALEISFAVRCGWETAVTFKNIISAYLDMNIFGGYSKVCSAGRAALLVWLHTWLFCPRVRRSLVPLWSNLLNCVCRIYVEVKHEQVWCCHVNSHCHLLRDKCKLFGHGIHSFDMCACNY